MSFVEDGDNGVLTGVAEKILVPAPDPGVRRIVITLTIRNPLSGAPIIIAVKKKNTAGVDSEIWSGTLDPGDTWIFGDGDREILGKSTQSIVAYTTSAPVIEPEWTSAWGDSA